MRLTSYRLFQGTLAHALSFVVGQIILPVLLVPIMVDALGEAEYGKWALMITLGGWLLFLDFGLHQSIPRFAGACAAAGDGRRFTALLSTFTIFFLGFAIPAAAATWIAAPGLLRLLVGNPTPGDVLTLRLVFLFQIATAGWRGGRGFLEGVQRITQASWAATFLAVAQFVVLVAALRAHATLPVVAAVCLAVNLLQGIWFARLIAAVRIGETRPGFFCAGAIEKNLFVQMLTFGLVLYLARLLGNVMLSDRLYLGWAGASLETITHYHLAAVMVGKLAALMATFSVALYPAAAALAESGNRDHLRTMTLRGFKFHVIAGTLMFPFLFCFVSDIFRAWMGRPMPEAEQFTRLLAPWGMTSVIGSLTAIGAGLGRPGYQLKSSILALVFAVPLFPLLIFPFGAPGLAITVSISVTAVAAVYLFDFKRRILETGARELLWNPLIKPAAGAVLLILPWAIDRIAAPWLPPDRIVTALKLALLFSVYAAAYAGWALKLGVIDREDRDRVASWIRTIVRPGA